MYEKLKSKYPSRSALKLLHALDFFRKKHHLSIKERICIDFGSSHGGFVKVLLDEGAKKVYSVDVAYGILDYNLRKNEKVIIKERTNLRNIDLTWFSLEDQKLIVNTNLSTPEFEYEKADFKESQCKNLDFDLKRVFLTCDVSFISASTVLNVWQKFVTNYSISYEALILIKPQFEASTLTQKGVITDMQVREDIIENIIAKAKKLDLKTIEVTPVEPKGTHGNQEYMLYLKN